MNKHILTIIPVIALAIAASNSAATAAPSHTKAGASTKPAPAKESAVPSTAEVAKSDLARIAAAFKGARTLTYTSIVTMATRPGSAAETIAVKASMERPNLVRLEVDSGDKMIGLAVSDGNETYAYDPAQNRYTKTDAAAGAMNATIPAELRNAELLVSGPMGVAMFTAQMFADPNPYDLTLQPVPGGVLLSDVSAVLNGVPVSHVSERVTANGKSLTLHIFLDKATSLPKRVAEDVTVGGTTLEVLREDFSKIEVGTAPLEAANFTWTPPGDSKLVTAPSPQDQEKPALAAGANAPDFAVETAAGKLIHLSDYKGKVIVLDFWATWCGPCQLSLPHTNAIAKSYMSKGVVFLPICTGDDKGAFKTWLTTHKSMSLQFFFDPAGTDMDDSFSVKLYGVQLIPTQYVIGKDGKIVTGLVGYDSQGDPEEKTLQQALDKAISAT